MKEERDERCEEILNIQAMGLKKRMEHIHSRRSAVVGLSGGLDSTLALLVMARAFDRMGMPREQIHCVDHAMLWNHRQNLSECLQVKPLPWCKAYRGKY